MRFASMRALDISNGENVGVSLFVQGCDRNPHCKNCFNPDTWDFNGGREWTEETKNQFLKLIDRPYIKRVSLLGGEPLAEQNLKDVLFLIKRIRHLFPNKIIWLYTGYDFDFLQKKYNEYRYDESKYTIFSPEAVKWITRWRIISNVDILVDGEYIDKQRNLSKKWAGSDNQRVINIKETIKNNKIILHCN